MFRVAKILNKYIATYFFASNKFSEELETKETTINVSREDKSSLTMMNIYNIKIDVLLALKGIMS